MMKMRMLLSELEPAELSMSINDMHAAWLAFRVQKELMIKGEGEKSRERCPTGEASKATRSDIL
jgi:hypothetical protein